MFSKTLAGALGAGILALGAAGSAQAAIFNVNTTADSGGGSLRSALNATNGTAAVDTIKFAIPGNGVHTITPTTPLPTITQPVTIKGYSQTDAAPATDTTPATLKIVIDALNVDAGLDVAGDGVVIRGLNIQRALGEGVRVEGNDNVVAGNYIGTGVTGAATRGNDSEGVRVSGDDNLVGGPDAADRNVITGSDFADVLVEDGTGNTVQNNHIGTDVGGVTDLGDARGVQLASSGNDVRDNLISGESTGVEIAADDNVVQGNKLGTNAAGTVALPNIVGVSIVGGDDNEIGGPGDGEGNLLSGNERHGVELNRFSTTDPAQRNKVEGNQVGTTAAGDAPLPNGEAGVSVSESDNNTIGGTGAGAGNVISGNDGDGVELAAADNNKVLGNWIGTDATAALDLGNDGAGVDIDGINNRVGDTVGTLAPNTIAHNGEDGVTVNAGTGNAVVRNSIHDNSGLAIDLGANGSTANDTDDADTGANDLQNGPEIDSASATEVEWSLESTQDTRFRLEFYANDTCSASHNSEAQTYLGTETITTDANGDADDSTPITLPPGAGPNVTMTATRLALVFVPAQPIAQFAPRSTSEVSPCEEIS
jgi:trimeric autotransporter adhesin